MMNPEKMIASLLLDIGAIKLSPTQPFTWASGWKSPIYCDNRKTLSYPDIRSTIRDEFVRQIIRLYPEADAIAGVATGAIAQGALVADKLELPFLYVRSSAKQHGLGNQVEGSWKTGQKVVVIEDLVSTGGSSLGAVNALREEGLEVLGMLAIFTYGFQIAGDQFRKAGVKLHTLSQYHALLDLATDTGYITPEQKKLLQEWRNHPDTWGQN